MTKLLKIAGVTAGKQASGIKVDEFGRIELSRTVEPKRIIGNVLEPYAEDYRGPVSVFGLELYAINSEYKTEVFVSSSQPTPDGWLHQLSGNLIRYDSKGAVIWRAVRRAGGSSARDGIPVVHGGHVYSASRIAGGGGQTMAIDKISYKTGEIVQEGVPLDGAVSTPVQLTYAADIDRLVGVFSTANDRQLIYVHPQTLEVVYSGTALGDRLTSIFGGGSSGFISPRCVRGVLYILADAQGVVSAKIDADINVTIQRLTKLFNNETATSNGIVLNGDVYSEQFGAGTSGILRNGKTIYVRETPKTSRLFVGGSAGNLALMADGNKVLAFDKDNLVMSVEIPHDILISDIAGDSMGNIFVGTTGGVYILGDTLQIKGYQLVG